MSIYNVMQTGVSGMAAQATRVSTSAENIANSDTTGYKRASIEFSTIVEHACPNDFNPGGVMAHVQNDISEQGGFEFTTSSTDLAISGEGFFVVTDESGRFTLTRAGSFVLDNDGQLVNAAGHYLMGYGTNNQIPNVTANGTAGLEIISFNAEGLEAVPSDEGHFQVNLPVNDEITPAANLPSANGATSDYSAKTSLVTYDNVGNVVTIDIYAAKTAVNTWEYAVYDRADEDPGGGFPYASGPLATTTLLFDPANGQFDPASPTAIDIPIPNGVTLDLDLSGTTELATDYTLLDTTVNGASPGPIENVSIDKDGIVSAQYSTGKWAELYRIPLAHVASIDKLIPLGGTNFDVNPESGDLEIGFPRDNGLGAINSNTLERSTVDIAEELTTLIQAQRNYTANSKVFQTGSELLDVLVNLKR